VLCWRWAFLFLPVCCTPELEMTVHSWCVLFRKLWNWVCHEVSDAAWIGSKNRSKGFEKSWKNPKVKGLLVMGH
jgi:hypothetical protein